MDNITFSLSDHLRPCLHTCFPSFNRPSRSPSPSDLFPDSLHRPLLSEADEDHLPDYYSQSASSQLSRWDLLISWLCSKTSDRLPPHHPFNDDFQTSALPHSQEADALLLDDISIALHARSARRKSVPASPLKSHTSQQPQPIPSPSVISLCDKNHRRKARTPQHPHTTVSRTSRSTQLTKNCIKDANLTHAQDPNLSVHPPSKSCKSRSKSSRQSVSACTDETLDTEPSSVPSLMTRRSTTESSSGSSSYHPLKLNVEIIKFIHQNYNHESRRLYGRDLSRVQIQQLCEYLVSRKLGHPPTSASLVAQQSGLDTAHVLGPDADHQKLDQPHGLPVHVPSSSSSHCKIEVESLERIQLSTTEFLHAIKQTKTLLHQLPSAPTDVPQDPGMSPAATDDLFDLELEDHGLVSTSLLDWLSKGSQITSQLFNNLSVNDST
ncbi:hypothetical protein VP01_1475g1 [Puccinia sorghi]|uniref:Uncharacterized protein n=1 Tax=Puccinia sorghi TaxID=27349 RepID=A0A0L6VK88_9BASI|nr:hypothetical protein VP01_1475g1 [Puccinia sorghi]